MIHLSPDAVDDVARLRTFLDHVNAGAARRALELIWTAIERLQDFPTLGMPTDDPEIRQIVVRFGGSGSFFIESFCSSDRRRSATFGSSGVCFGGVGRSAGSFMKGSLSSSSN